LGLRETREGIYVCKEGMFNIIMRQRDKGDFFFVFVFVLVYTWDEFFLGGEKEA
jgi:hypothetical protein